MKPSFSSPRLVAGLLVCSLLQSCGEEGTAPRSDLPEGAERKTSALSRNTTPSETAVPALGINNADFAFDLYRAIAADSANLDNNLVFSPHSLSTSLAMTYEGARGTTESEMKTALHFELEKPVLHEALNATDLALASRGTGKLGADGTPFRLDVDNSLWTQRDFPIVANFLDVLASNYGAGVFQVDFTRQTEVARKAINSWVASKTEELIPELLRPGILTGNTRIVLTNTVYLNAGWPQKFRKENTVDAPFTKLDGSAVQSRLMVGTFEGIAHGRGSNYQAVALPYEDTNVRLIAVLPDAGALADLEANLSSQWFRDVNDSLVPGDVSIQLPQLDLTWVAELIPQLQSLGMAAAFGPSADFSGMTPTSVFIEHVVHQSVLKVLEGGTVAAGATAVVFGHKSAVQMPQVVRFDRPFLFAIVDRPTGAILFLGRVLDPTAK